MNNEQAAAPHIISIVNTNTSSKKWKKFSTVLCHYYPRMQTFYTNEEFHAAELTKYHLNSFDRIAEPIIVLAAGGDGLLNECLNGILASDFADSPLIYLMSVPLGTANDFWRSFYKINPKLVTPMMIADAIKKCTAEPCDVGLCTASAYGAPLAVSGSAKRYFVNVASAGLSGDIANKTRKSRCRCLGRRVYLWEAIKACIFGSKKRLMMLTVDDQQTIDDFLMVAIGNSTSFGGKMHICPEACATDQMLDVSAVRNPSSICKLNRLMNNLYAGKKCLATNRHVSMYRSPAIIKLDPVHPQSEILVECDGELVGKLPATFELAGQISMLML